ncbi:TIGR04086 family membrane protein [Virgibacillus sp. SK37]|uniref:TIGR04086 family membrane protein n=1 Tax=Virgibacillus sp. SK37 TaxID=403957 RepID=UPI0004D0FA37|nr:TIGR04086 family membrane protein [Virgibacillus sp. SK37]AIF43322.1 membrane protein [Virgibacillus sp. SK37]
MTKQLTAVVYGLVMVLGLILITSIFLALLLRFTSFNDPILSWVTLGIGLISLFIGGLVAGAKGKAKGWIIGGVTGFGFTLFTFLVQYLGYQQGFSLEQSIHHLAYISAAVLGGIVGVNTLGTKTE